MIEVFTPVPSPLAPRARGVWGAVPVFPAIPEILLTTFEGTSFGGKARARTA